MYHSVMNYALSGGSVEAQQEEHLTEMILPECPREMQALLGLLNDGWGATGTGENIRPMVDEI